MGYIEAALVLVLRTSTGEVLDTEIVRTFAKDRHCVQFYFDPQFDLHLQEHGINYWLGNKQYAKPGFVIEFICRKVGPYYTA